MPQYIEIISEGLFLQDYFERLQKKSLVKIQLQRNKSVTLYNSPT